MAEFKRYTADQLKSATALAELLASVPEDKKAITIMMINSFMAGMEAQEALGATA